MDILGRWYYATWLGGKFTIEQSVDRRQQCADDDAAVHGLDIGIQLQSVTFSQDQSTFQLARDNDGYWEGPRDSGLRLFRHGSYLVLHRERSDKQVSNQQVKQVFAARSSIAAACLCYRLTLGSCLSNSCTKKTRKERLLSPAVPGSRIPVRNRPSDTLVGASALHSALDDVTRATSDASVRSRPSAAKILLKATKPEDYWPEPEADGQPRQPSTAQGPISDERLVQQPQVLSYCSGVSMGNQSSGERNGVNAAESLKPVAVMSPRTPPGSSVPRTPPGSSVLASFGPMTPRELDYVSVDISEDIPEERQPGHRMVADVAELSTTVHGLFSVPENAELPDVASPEQPSKSDSSLLHGSVAFQSSGSNPVLGDIAFPAEATMVQREISPAELARALGINATHEEDPRVRPNPLVRSNKVGANLGVSRERQPQGVSSQS